MSSAKVKEGIEQMLGNAENLLQDAQVLARRGSYSAFMLAVAGLEELGKAVLVHEKQHRSRSGKIILGNWFCSHRRKLDALKDFVVSPPKPLQSIIDWAYEAKLESIYVDWSRDLGMWTAPQQYVRAALEILRAPEDATQLAQGGLRILEDIRERIN